MNSDGLDLRRVHVHFGDLRAVDGVDLSIAPGEVVALLGPSGCGKSTLLRAIAGLEPLAGGSIHWQGRDLSALATHKRGIGLMFQHHALFPHRSAGENVAFGLRMLGTDRATQRQRVGELLAVVDLEGFEDRTIGTLSGGQAQRVALARALAPEPSVLLLDEPLGSLDRALRDRLVGEIRDIVTRLGITTVHVTHDQDEAATIADRVAVMRSGRIVAVDTMDTLTSEPGDAATAAFLGLVSLWSAPVAHGVAATPFGPVDAGVDRGVATLFLRPESVALALEASKQSAPAQVRGAQRTGTHWRIVCSLGNIDFHAYCDRRLSTGTTVHLSASPRDISVLAVDERADDDRSNNSVT